MIWIDSHTDNMQS